MAWKLKGSETGLDSGLPTDSTIMAKMTDPKLLAVSAKLTASDWGLETALRWTATGKVLYSDRGMDLLLTATPMDGKSLVLLVMSWESDLASKKARQLKESEKALGLDSWKVSLSMVTPTD
jgi:hypothetical protein